MGSIDKSLALILILIMVISSLSLIIVKSTSAQTIPTPSVPEFNAKIVDHSYDVPQTYVNYTNPYTGQQETRTQGGYHVENKTIDVTIKNQPVATVNIDGNITQLFYVIRWKGHFENWNDTSDFNDVSDQYYFDSHGIQASNSEYTVKTYGVPYFSDVPEGGQVDFQVRAQIGFLFEYFGGHIQAIGTDFHYVAESDWSNIQTLTVNNSNSTATTSLSATLSPTPATTPTVSEFPTLILSITFLLTATLLGTVMIKRKQSIGWIV
jgi:hypothetical protein